MAHLLDRLRLELLYRRKVGRKPNFNNPTYLTEKIQVAKLTWRSPRMVELADKVLAKQVVAEKLGPEWITPTLFAGPTLPPRDQRNWPIPYVIKINHRSGGNYFVTRPEDLDWDQIEAKVDRWLRRSYGTPKLEWVYKPIKRQVLVEPFIGTGEPPADYRLHVFGGKVEFTAINWERFAGLKRALYDRNWNRLHFVMSDATPYYGDDIPPKPASYDEMVRGAEILAADFPFARVDFYEIDGRPRFGEVTFYPHSGLFRMPEEIDRQYGALFPNGVPA
jgi:hypothetical protein